MSLDPQEVEELFQQGLLIAPGVARDAWLDRVSGERSELRNRLSRLLAAATPTDDFLERPVIPVVSSISGLAMDVLPERVGRYRIVEILGKGGMGVVCRAEQTEPVQRQVALKLIRPGLDSDRIVARFEAERQSLALMDHANIARVLDAGATVDGRPWFAMELVSGQPITEYCDRHRLSTEERLALLIPVCQAVQHAHHKGIIHRDLKPGNILVTDCDGTPMPKVIDFGVAKAVGLAADAPQLTTGSGVVVGTMEYMSPEQAGLNQLDVDTRTDVYSLGIVMYELLTGSPPFSRAEYPDGNLYDMLRRIREQEPTRPSEKLSTAEALTGLADRRRADPRQLMGIVRGELDWIVLRALEKDREHRYSSAAEFAADIRRFLSGEVVTAAPPGRLYRFRKFWRRHRLAMTATAAIVVSLLIGLIGASWGMLTAQAAADAEKSARLRESEQRRYAEGVSNFLVEDVLALTTREGQLRFDSNTLTRNAKLQDLLQRAALRLNHRELDDEIAADLHWIIGVSQRASGDAQSAIPHLERSVGLWTRSLGPDHERTLNARHSLGIALHSAGEFKRAQQEQENLLSDLLRVRGENDLQSLYAMHALAETRVANDQPFEARALLETAVAGFHQLASADRESVLNAELSLTLALEQCGETEKAITQFRDIVLKAKSDLGLNHLLTLRSQEELAMSLYQDGQFAEALELLENVVPALVEQLGETHPAALDAQSDQAIVLQGLGRLSEALPMLQNVVRVRRQVLLPDHPEVMTAELNLAVAITEIGHAQEAVTLLESCLERLNAQCGPDHPLTLLCLHNLGDALSQCGQSQNALDRIEESIQRRTRRYGADHPQTLISLNLKGRCLQRLGRLEEATEILERVLECRRQDQGPDHLDTLVAATNLAAVYRNSGRTSDAIRVAESAVESGRKVFGTSHPVVVSAMNNLAVAYWKEKQLDRSVPLFEEVVRQRTAVDPQHSDCLMACANLGINYRDSGRTEDAVELLRQADRRRYQSPDLAWVHRELRSLCLATGRSEQLARFLMEDLQQYRAEFGDTSTPVAMLVFEGTLELLNSDHVDGAAQLLAESRSLFQAGKTPDEHLQLFNALVMLAELKADEQKSLPEQPATVLDWLEDHGESLSPAIRPLFVEVSQQLIEQLESAPDLQARWKSWLMMVRP